jgi:hypothetical protein
MNRRAVRAASTLCGTWMRSSGGILNLRGFHDRASEVTAQILRGTEIHSPSADQVGQPGFEFAQRDETRLPPRLDSTSRSMSLSGRAVPPGVESNRDSRRTWKRRQPPPERRGR